MTRRLRRGSGQNGLILANGGVLSYQHAICLSTRPRKNGTHYPNKKMLPAEPATQIPPTDMEAHGKAKIEVRPFFFFFFLVLRVGLHKLLMIG